MEWRRPGQEVKLVAMENGRARTELHVESGFFPPSADSIVAVGHAAALAASASVVAPTDGLDPRVLPRTLQVSLNLFRQAEPGSLTADAELTFRTRTTLIIDVKVRDARQRLVAALAVTQLAPSHADAAASRLAS